MDHGFMTGHPGSNGSSTKREDNMTCVREILREKPAGVWTIEPQALVYTALELMADKNIGALPVVEAGQMVGMFSERDYARKVILKGRSSRATTVGELMSYPVITVGPDETIETCMQLMTARHIRHLPVLENDKLVGVVSIGDILKAIIVNQQVMIRDLENYITGARS
jgi:signal-transduction protein with cAMP-binding, CBS, and nucleotidyltransferase domain